MTDSDDTFGQFDEVTALGFDELRAYHDRLEAHRAQCAGVCRDRQEDLGGATSHDVAVGITHRSLVEHVYANLSVTHPVLDTATRLSGICTECQRTVRDHLVRRA
ncbi:DUF7260 family protein [Halorubrum pallidum]